MDKETILGLPFYPHECGGMIECVTKQDALKAMDSFGEIRAIAFAEWIKSENYFHGKDGTWCKIPNWDNKYLTTKELYKLFTSGE